MLDLDWGALQPNASRPPNDVSHAPDPMGSGQPLMPTKLQIFGGGVVSPKTMSAGPCDALRVGRLTWSLPPTCVVAIGAPIAGAPHADRERQSAGAESGV